MRIIFIKIFLYISAFMPLPASHGLGYLAGWGLFLFPSHSRRITQINLALCFPALSAREQRKLVRKSLIEMCKTAFEAGALWLRPGEKTLRLIKKTQGSELVDGALAAGNGVILATPHQGAWEAAGLFSAAHYNITGLYRPLKMQQLDALVTRARSRLGGNYVPANAGGIRILMKTLKQGDAVAMLPDQEPLPGSGVFAPFFGVPAYSMVFLGRLAEKSGAPVIFAWCERLSWGRGYRLNFRNVPAGAYSADSIEAASAVNQVVEDCARTNIAQYQWSYRRFRRRPEGEQEFRVLIAQVRQAPRPASSVFQDTLEKDFHFLRRLHITVSLCSADTGFECGLRIYRIPGCMQGLAVDFPGGRIIRIMADSRAQMRDRLRRITLFEQGAAECKAQQGIILPRLEHRLQVFDHRHAG